MTTSTENLLEQNFTVLLVEDEPSIRGYHTALLQSLGYNVLLA